jgi:DNA-binding FrmR family transcriptional regulator
MDSRKSIDHRLAIIEGHLKAVRKMVAEDKPGIDIIRQSRAVQSALKKFDAAVLDQFLNTAVAQDVAQGKTAKAVKELSELFGLI